MFNYFKKIFNKHIKNSKVSKPDSCVTPKELWKINEGVYNIYRRLPFSKVGK
jgi:hypothetical protein